LQAICPALKIKERRCAQLRMMPQNTINLRIHLSNNHFQIGGFQMIKAIIISFLLLFSLSSCTFEKSDWEKAKKINTIISYNQFISKYPKSIFVNFADSIILSMQIQTEFVNALKSNSIDSLNVFMSKYKSTKYIIPIIKPINCDISVDGTFYITDSLIKGKARVLKAGDFSKKGGRANLTADMGFWYLPGGGIGISLPTNCTIDESFSIWFDGSIHTIKGYVRNFGIDSSLFISDSLNPLTFKLVKNIGYVYLKGKGKISFSDGKFFLYQ
jgi:hypothetical protein